MKTRFENLSLIIVDRVIDLIIEARIRVKILSLSVLSNFDDSSINTRETNILALIEILI